MGEAWAKRERRAVRRSTTLTITMANVGAAIAGAFGARLNPSDFIPTFPDDDDEPDEEAIKREEELQAKLRAADQRALLAALKASTKPKTT